MPGMTEFLSASSLFQAKKSSLLGIQGHIFKNGDVEIKVGILYVNHPKFLLVQVTHRLLIQSLKKGQNIQDHDYRIREQTRQVSELIRYCLSMDQDDVEKYRHQPILQDGDQPVDERMG